TVRRLLFAEGMLVAIAGSLVGLAAAVGYAALLLRVLNRWWADSLQISFLQLHITAVSLTIGFVLSVAIAALAVLGALRGLRRLSPRELLAGQWSAEQSVASKSSRRRTIVIAGSAFGVAVALAGASFAVPADQAAGLFFGSGAALLIAGL